MEEYEPCQVKPPPTPDANPAVHKTLRWHETMAVDSSGVIFSYNRAKVYILPKFEQFNSYNYTHSQTQYLFEQNQFLRGK